MKDWLYIIDKTGYTGTVQSTMSNGIVHYSDGLTLEQYNEKKGKEYIALTWDELEPLIAAWEHDNYTSIPAVLISAEDYEEALNVLPPERWENGMFCMCEHLTGNLTAWYAEKDGKFASCTEYANASIEHMRDRFAVAFA